MPKKRATVITAALFVSKFGASVSDETSLVDVCRQVGLRTLRATLAGQGILHQLIDLPGQVGLEFGGQLLLALFLGGLGYLAYLVVDMRAGGVAGAAGAGDDCFCVHMLPSFDQYLR